MAIQKILFSAIGRKIPFTQPHTPYTTGGLKKYSLAVPAAKVQP